MATGTATIQNDDHGGTGTGVTRAPDLRAPDRESARDDEPTPMRLFLAFGRIGLTSFGGGLSGWLLREFVQARRWISEEDFLNGLSLSQALPGVNVTNMAIWIGYRLLGLRGAVAGLCGIIVPAAMLIVLIGALFERLNQFALTRPALDGAAAAAIGLSLSMGVTVARRVPRRAAAVAGMAATFVAVAFLHLPLVWVVVVVGALSIGWEYHRLGRR